MSCEKKKLSRRERREARLAAKIQRSQERHANGNLAVATVSFCAQLPTEDEPPASGRFLKALPPQIEKIRPRYSADETEVDLDPSLDHEDDIRAAHNRQTALRLDSERAFERMLAWAYAEGRITDVDLEHMQYYIELEGFVRGYLAGLPAARRAAFRDIEGEWLFDSQLKVRTLGRTLWQLFRPRIRRGVLTAIASGQFLRRSKQAA
jgi:hypothetical protein